MYFALLCIENLLEGFEGDNVVKRFNKTMITELIVLAQRHKNFWVRLSTQRIFGHLFSHFLKATSKVTFASLFLKENDKYLLDSTKITY